MTNPIIYSASKIWHAKRWQYMRDTLGYNINATWIDIPCGSPSDPTGAKLLTDEEKCDLWVDCSNQTRDCDMLICYAEKNDEQRGALVEIGGALANDNPVYLIGNCPSFMVAGHSDVAFTKHPLFHRVPTEGNQQQGYDFITGYEWAVEHYLNNYSPEKVFKETLFLHEGFTSGQSRIQQEATTDAIKLLRAKENALY